MSRWLKHLNIFETSEVLKHLLKGLSFDKRKATRTFLHQSSFSSFLLHFSAGHPKTQTSLGARAAQKQIRSESKTDSWTKITGTSTNEGSLRTNHGNCLFLFKKTNKQINSGTRRSIWRNPHTFLGNLETWETQTC